MTLLRADARKRKDGATTTLVQFHDEAGAFRVIHVARFTDTIYVLHCFQKKTQATGKPDLELATRRYRDFLQELTS